MTPEYMGSGESIFGWWERSIIIPVLAGLDLNDFKILLVKG